MIDVTASKKKRIGIVVAASVVLVLFASAITYCLMAENNESINNGREIVLNNKTDVSNEPVLPEAEAAKDEASKAASYYFKYKELIDAERLRLSEVMAVNFANPQWRQAKMERAGRVYINHVLKRLVDGQQPGLGVTLIPVFEGSEFNGLRINASPAGNEKRVSTVRERAIQLEQNNRQPDPYTGYSYFIKVLDTAGYVSIITDKRGYILHLPLDEAFSYLSDEFKVKLFSEKELAQWFLYNHIIKERIRKHSIYNIGEPFVVYGGGGKVGEGRSGDVIRVNTLAGTMVALRMPISTFNGYVFNDRYIYRTPSGLLWDNVTVLPVIEPVL